MFGRRFRLFSIFGFEIRLDASWIVIAVLVTWSLAAGLFPAAFPGLSTGAYWWMGVAGALGLFCSIVLHELCHSLVANHYRLPMKGITLFIFGGVAEMGGEPQSPRIEFLMAAAGPACSIVLGFLFHGIAGALRHGAAPALAIFSYLAWINWALAGFNLIPGFPLDGGRMLRAALWHWKGDLMRATRIASHIGSGFGFLLMGFAVYQLFLGRLVSAIWYFLIGSFLRGAAQSSYEQLLMRSALAGERVRRFMRPDPVAVSPDMSLREFVNDFLYRYDFKLFPVVNEAHDLLGCVNGADLKGIPQEEWDRHRVAELARPCSAENTIDPDADAMAALAKMGAADGKGLLVMERNRLLAIVSARDVLNFIAAKLRLEGRPAQLLP